MQPKSTDEYKKLLTDVIKKQIVILGPNITLIKAKNVKGITVTEDGTVTNIDGNPQEITQQLVNQFMELSGLIVKKTMEPLLSYHQNGDSAVIPTAPASISTPPAIQPAQANNNSTETGNGSTGT